MAQLICGLDISKTSATYCLLDGIPEDPKRYIRKGKQLKLDVLKTGKDDLLSLEFEFAVLEPTGVYSRIWRHWLRQAGRPYRLVGHKELAAFRSGWKLDKRDKLDSLAMALYGLERRDRPEMWLTEHDYALSDLILFHGHLNRQKNGLQNNLRQKLVWQVTELYDRQIKRSWREERIPGILQAIAGNPSEKWRKEIEATYGVGLNWEASALAQVLIAMEQQEMECERRIEAELLKPQYQRYLIAAQSCEFSPWLTARLTSAVYPFEQFLTNGKRRKTHTLTQNDKRVLKDESLRSFKLACGLGLIWVQSGDFEGWTAGGNGDLRKELRNSIAFEFLRQKRLEKQGRELDLELQPIKSTRDSHTIRKAARKWVEAFYKELVKEFQA